MVRVRSSTLCSTFFPLFVVVVVVSITVYGLLFLAEHSKYVAAVLFIFKACTKEYVVNSCLTPPLNTDIVKQ